MGFKGKVIPVQAVEALRVARGWGSHIFRHSAHRWRQGCQSYAPAAFYPQEDSWYSFLLEAESTPGLEGLGKLKKSTSSGIRTGNLPACSIVAQPTTLSRAPIIMGFGFNNFVYWHFFTFRIDYNSSYIELLLKKFWPTNLLLISHRSRTDLYYSRTLPVCKSPCRTCFRSLVLPRELLCSATCYRLFLVTETNFCLIFLVAEK
jgi:hypothetical protein